jgi:molybdopterin-guanine dinucleotide biosynthesis protein A
MGRDKALLKVDGRPLIELAVERLRGLGLKPRICGARPDLARFAAIVPDRFEGCGPLGGLEAALAASDSDLNLFLPVDLPNLPGAFLRWMMERAEATGAAATIPVCGGRAQPLCAVYSRRLLAGLRAALESGSYKMVTAVEAAAAQAGERVDAFAVEMLAAALIPETWPAEPPVHEWFRNINTPREYARLVGSDSAATAGANRRDPLS